MPSLLVSSFIIVLEEMLVSSSDEFLLFNRTSGLPEGTNMNVCIELNTASINKYYIKP
jgi:hypothetical protein